MPVDKYDLLMLTKGRDSFHSRLDIPFFIFARYQNSSGKFSFLLLFYGSGDDILAKTQLSQARKRSKIFVDKIAEPGDSFWDKQVKFCFYNLKISQREEVADVIC